MIDNICNHLRNYFVYKEHNGTFKIENNALLLDVHGYIKIDGSRFNDGVYLMPAILEDEEFKGTVYELALPKKFIEIVNKIEEYQKNQKPSDFTSESFGGYSYTKGEQNGWKKAFKNELNQWRKLCL